MGKTVMLKRSHESLDDEVAFLIDKINYLLRKVETYDRALNEFNQIKLIIEEAKENTRLSKDIVRETKDSIGIASTDIDTLSKSIKNLANRFDNHCDHTRRVIGDLDIRSFDEDEKLELSIETLRQTIQEDLKSYLTVNDLRDIKKNSLDHRMFLERCISNAHENNFALEIRIKKLEERLDINEEKMMSIRKDMCRFQNALLRKGVPLDDQ